MLFVHGPLGLRMDAFEQAWALLKAPPLYHGTNREAAASIMREGLKPTGGQAPQLFEHSPEEIREAMALSGADPSEYERLFGGDWGFAYSGEDDAIRHAGDWAEHHVDGEPAVLEIDDKHPDMPPFIHEPEFPQSHDSPYFQTPLDYGFNSAKGQVRTNQVIPPHLIRQLSDEELEAVR